MIDDKALRVWAARQLRDARADQIHYENMGKNWVDAMGSASERVGLLLELAGELRRARRHG